jgi:hypothetical protein
MKRHISDIAKRIGGKTQSKHDLVFMDYEFEDKGRNGIDIINHFTK